MQSMLSDAPEDSGDECLSIEIEGAQLQSLGFGEGNLPQVGQKFQMTAMVEVIEVCKEDGAIAPEYCVEFKLENVSLNSPMNDQQAAMARIDRLYG